MNKHWLLVFALLVQSTGAMASGIIVKYSDPAMNDGHLASTSMAAKMSEMCGVKLSYDRTLGIDADLLMLPDDIVESEVDRVLGELQSDPNVAFAELDEIRQLPEQTVHLLTDKDIEALGLDNEQPDLRPSDRFARFQWAVNGARNGINVRDAWDTHTGSGTVIAILDTGIAPHLDLDSALLPGYDFIRRPDIAQDGDGRDADPNDPGDWIPKGACGVDENGDPSPSRDRDSSWHGTHVAGIAAARAGTYGVIGVAYDANILPVRVLGRCGGLLSDTLDAITWASGGPVEGVPNNPNPADVINLSLGSPDRCQAAEQLAIDQAVGRGTFIVATAGNRNSPVSGSPAICNNVISTAATNPNGNRSPYSSFGPTVTLAAPGGDFSFGSRGGILSTYNAGDRGPEGPAWAYVTGTSQAAPMVSGVAALVLEKQPFYSPDTTRWVLEASAKRFRSPSTCVGICGAGLLDAKNALNLARFGLRRANTRLDVDPQL